MALKRFEPQPLPTELLDKIRARLCDEWRRTGDGDWLRIPQAVRPPETAGAFGALATALSYRPDGGRRLKPIRPLRQVNIRAIETKLGFRLPPDLRQLYREIGNGGFGPFEGLRPLSRCALDYRRLRERKFGVKQRRWPARLFPLTISYPHRICLDRTSGEIVRFTNPPPDCSDAKWDLAFAPIAASLIDFLARWVGSPTRLEGGPDGGLAPAPSPPDEHLLRARSNGT